MSQSSEKIVAFIVARLSSSRFPAKQMRNIGDQSLLSWCLHNVKQSRRVDSIVLATSAEDSNLPLRNFAEENDIELFWYTGHPNEVTTRLCSAAKHHKADICVLISGDCPLTDGKAIDHLIDVLSQHPENDYISLANKSKNQACMLQGVSVARSKAWHLAEQLSDSPELKEHHFPVLYRRKDVFTSISCTMDISIYGKFHRLSVDTFADLSFFSAVYHRLNSMNLAFNLENVVALLEKYPELKDVNKHVQQRKVIEYIPNILLFAPLLNENKEERSIQQLRNMELALFITESRGWPVRILTNDSSLAKEANHRGLRHYFYSNSVELLEKVSSFDSPLHLILANGANLLEVNDIQQLISSSSSTILLGETCVNYQSQGPFLHMADFYKSASNVITGADAISNFILKQI